MEWKDWTGKKVFVQLKSGAVYSGVINEVSDVGEGYVFISMKDKFGKLVMFSVLEIIKLVEEK
jgi:hypothetical protein